MHFEDEKHCSASGDNYSLEALPVVRVVFDSGPGAAARVLGSPAAAAPSMGVSHPSDSRISFTWCVP